MRLHVVGLPHTQSTVDFVQCAYTQKVRKFCKMMFERGHEVFLYSGIKNDAPCTEHIPCITYHPKKTSDYLSPAWDADSTLWRQFNTRAALEISKRARSKDFICVIGGCAHKPIADALPHLMTIEFGIGYAGTFAKYRVWESYAWMHTVYGKQAHNPMNEEGKWFDVVIPNFFDIQDFPYSKTKDDYYLFIGRLTELKGYQIAADVCEKLGKRLILAGSGNPPTYGEYIGPVDTQRRGELMSRALATFVPTRYLEPFGGVAVESMLCGTPVITTDWGAFTETVVDGFNGFRCRTFAEFCRAARIAPELPTAGIRKGARGKYSLEAVAPLYERYFERLQTLWGKGWYA